MLLYILTLKPLTWNVREGIQPNTNAEFYSTGFSQGLSPGMNMNIYIYIIT